MLSFGVTQALRAALVLGARRCDILARHGVLTSSVQREHWLGGGGRAHSVRTSTTQPKKHFPRVISTPEDAVKAVHSNSTVFIHSVASAPQVLIKAMVARAPELRNVTTCSIHTEGAAPYTEPQYAESFRHSAFFIGSNIREAVNAGRADFTPIFLSEIPQLFKRGLISLNVALISVSKPDHHGYCSLGPSVDCSLAAVENADVVIAQINSHVPRCHGSGLIE
jgi:acyl-CoA hydrolase